MSELGKLMTLVGMPSIALASAGRETNQSQPGGERTEVIAKLWPNAAAASAEAPYAESDISIDAALGGRKVGAEEVDGLEQGGRDRDEDESTLR